MVTCSEDELKLSIKSKYKRMILDCTMRGQLYFPNKDESCHDPMTQGTVPILCDLRFKESIG